MNPSRFAKIKLNAKAFLNKLNPKLVSGPSKTVSTSKYGPSTMNILRTEFMKRPITYLLVLSLYLKAVNDYAIEKENPDRVNPLFKYYNMRPGYLRNKNAKLSDNNLNLDLS